MIPQGEIHIRWDAQGKLQVSAPMAHKELCCLMLCKAQEAILQYIPGLTLPNGVAPPDLRNKG